MCSEERGGKKAREVASNANPAALQALLRSIPSVDRILETDRVKELLQRYSRRLVLKAINNRLQIIRNTIRNGKTPAFMPDPITLDSVVSTLEDELRSFALPSLTKVINATGVILHTNLGRSPLAEEALRHLVDIASTYSNLEYDLKEGKRGNRYVHVEGLLCEITGADAAFAVNNNAAAVLLALNTIAHRKEVIVSRGELIEIGGSFRIPDIMRRSGAKMVEVGTTNKTHLSDYEEAIGPGTALLLKVHTSNYRIVGFTSEVGLGELVELGNKHQLPVLMDLGSGNLVDFSSYGISHEPTVQEVVKTGVDVITFSGDKLLGGPQAGIIVGKREIVGKLKKNPLNRALRIDKLTLAALESTLRLYQDQETVTSKIPALRMITIPLETIECRAVALKQRVGSFLPNHLELHIVDDSSQIGGGALPSQLLPTKTLALRSTRTSVQELERHFRKVRPPIITRIHRDHLRIDLRTVDEEDEVFIEDALRQLITRDS